MSTAETIENQPFSEWLEKAVKDIYENPPDSMMIMLYRQKEGQVTRFHYNMRNAEMAIFQQEMRMAELLQLIRDNPEAVRGMLDM